MVYHPGRTATRVATDSPAWTNTLDGNHTSLRPRKTLLDGRARHLILPAGVTSSIRLLVLRGEHLRHPRASRPFKDLPPRAQSTQSLRLPPPARHSLRPPQRRSNRSRYSTCSTRYLCSSDVERLKTRRVLPKASLAVTADSMFPL